LFLGGELLDQLSHSMCVEQIHDVAVEARALPKLRLAHPVTRDLGDGGRHPFCSLSM
jgi:hypothetical protein